MPNSLISVVFNTYNHRPYIREALQSLLCQTHSNLEILVVDDGSTDGTGEEVGSLKDSRIQYLYTANRGVSAAANRALEMAKGEFIALMSGDDVSLPTRFEIQLHHLQNECADLIFCRPQLIDEEGEPLRDDLKKVFFTHVKGDASRYFRQLFVYGNFLCAPSLLARSDVMRELGPFKRSLLQLQDYEMWVRALKRFKLHVLNERLLRYRIRSSGANLSAGQNFDRARVEMLSIYRDFFSGCSYDFLLKAFPEYVGVQSEYCPELLELDLDFIFLAHGDPAVRLVGIERLSQHIENPSTRELLHNEKGFSERDLFGWLNSVQIRASDRSIGASEARSPSALYCES